jgi:succinate dehydrogenase / fumarate reductase cytochrome b subunit
MIPLKHVVASTVGRKFIVALSGMALALFVIVHLLGNLQLLIPDPEPFNRYAADLRKLGPLLYTAELGLLALILLHTVIGVVLWKVSDDARETRYALAETKGGDSRWNLSSGHMLLLGVVLLVFIVVHVLQFRFQVFADHPYKTMLDGREVTDLHALVMDTFRCPLWVAFYMGTMFFLGFHLRHGLWSMFQSLGAMPTAYSNLIYVAGAVVAFLLALGFFILPLYLYAIQVMH